MSKIKNGGLDQYGPERFKQQQFGTPVLKGLMVMHKFRVCSLDRPVLDMIEYPTGKRLDVTDSNSLGDVFTSS